MVNGYQLIVGVSASVPASRTFPAAPYSLSLIPYSLFRIPYTPSVNPIENQSPIPSQVAQSSLDRQPQTLNLKL